MKIERQIFIKHSDENYWLANFQIVLTEDSL